MRASYEFALFLTVLIAADSVSAACPDKLRVNDGGTVDSSIQAQGLDRLVEEVIDEFQITPGIAVGITRADQVLYARGFGYLNLDDCAPVTDKSVFYLLSVTKSFTGMLAALLHEEGILELDQSLAHYYPELTMQSPINPGQTSIRDLLLHRAGFFSGGINYRTFIPGNLDSDGIYYLLERHARPAPITFRYSNMAYIIAGMVMEQVSEQSWRDLLEEKLFHPVGMTSTTAYIERARGGEFAYPYTVNRAGEYESAPVKVEAQMHAAGGMASSVQDLLRWVRLNLSGGQLDGKQMIPAHVVRQAHAPQIQFDWTFYKFRRYAYGLGVHNSDYEGDLLIHHFGGPIHVSFMPEHDLGIVVLTSGPRSTRMSHMLAAYLYDTVLGKEALDTKWTPEIAQVKKATFDSIQEFYTREDEILAQRAEHPLIRPLDAYVGTYASDRLGEMQVEVRGDRLLLTYGAQVKELIPYQANSFLIYLEPDSLPETFVFREQPEAAGFTLDWGGRLFEARSAVPPTE